MSEPAGFRFAPIEPSLPPPEKDARSRLGSGSVTLGIAAVIAFGSGFLLSNIEEIPFYWQLRYTIREHIDSIHILVYLLLCAAPLINMAGLGLGIAAIVLKTSGRKAGVAGAIINGLMLVFTLCSVLVYMLIR